MVNNYTGKRMAPSHPSSSAAQLLGVICVIIRCTRVPFTYVRVRNHTYTRNPSNWFADLMGLMGVIRLLVRFTPWWIITQGSVWFLLPWQIGKPIVGDHTFQCGTNIMVINHTWEFLWSQRETHDSQHLVCEFVRPAGIICFLMWLTSW